MQRRGRHVLRNIKFLLKKEKGSPFEKEESALRVSRDMIPERAASHNGLATQTRQPPIRDNARTSHQNQNQNIKILLYYTTTCPLLPPNREIIMYLCNRVDLGC